MNFIIIFTLIIFFSFSSFAINTNSTEAIVFDWNTNEVLFEKNPDKKVHPASLTKIMTVYLVFDRINNTNLSMDDNCTISPKAYKMGGSRTFLEIDEKVKLIDLLRGIIIQSGNDASIAIAECLSGTEEGFVELMNSYAKKLNLHNTNFTNSSGWPNDDHYSSVKDMAILSNALIKDFPTLYRLFNEKEFTYNNIKQPNRNQLIGSVDGVDGIKTGYTRKSGWGISLSAKRDDRRITVVINGANSSRQRLIESEKLVNWAFRETEQKKILEKNQLIKTVDVWLGSQPSVDLIINEDLITTVSYEQIKLIKSSIEYQKPISAPVKKGETLGKIIIDIPGKSTIEIPLVSKNKINSINPFLRIFAAAKYLIFGTALDE